MTPQQRHELAIIQIKEYAQYGPSVMLEAWTRFNDEAVAAFYDLTVEQLETNIQVCWR